ncbi:c-type cytochrome [Agaribacter marinus]|uniref:Cytochrome c domain-containing protein n=1 Tax=Agaribacter marinus TaxID=1431249 RepID=A0AA37WK21_9ALTE|nr:cytochrome c [Agaribacter marinus]GLR72902.1 hypothetical protein GCM10007852_38100 [Agaribacter marinus]
MRLSCRLLFTLFLGVCIGVNVSAQSEVNGTTSLSLDAQLDEELRALSIDKTTLAQGKNKYILYCLACHAKDLSGGNGFNLKDGVWVHGNRPSDLFNSVSRGFLAQGMPSFKDILSENDRKQIVAYVMSKREGFDNLTYEVYALDSNDDTSLVGKTPIKTGKLHDNLMDFTIPEIKEFGVVFEGDFYTYNDQPTRFRMGGRAFDLMTLEIDGESVEKLWKKGWNPTWLLKPGKQYIKLTYLSSKNPDYLDTNFLGYVTPEDGSIKYFATTARAQGLMANRTYNIEAKAHPVLQRKKIHKLPAGTISVGLPEKVNFAFDPSKCAINALWVGDFLNIGPNIDRRTGDPSLPLSEFIFFAPNGISPSQGNCEYLGYARNQNIRFNYLLNGIDVSLSANSLEKHRISFIFEIKKLDVDGENKKMTFSLPDIPSLKYLSEDGAIDELGWSFYPKENTSFKLDVLVSKDSS